MTSDIPLLLSRSSMKKANMDLNFEDDTVKAFNQDINLVVTKSGHYVLPLTLPCQLLSRCGADPRFYVTLSGEHTKSKEEIPVKLHRQFAHPPAHKLNQLLNSARVPWSKDKDLKEEIIKVSKNCSTCKVCKKPPNCPVVGLPTASKFQKLIAMDLNFCHGRILLHLVHHATRLSSASLITSKDPEMIIKNIFKNWISIYGTAGSFLTDNGGEFANQKFLDMCESMNITVKTTGAESPWSNGLVERHNLIINEMLDKVLKDGSCDFEVALAWCVNAKNSLQNVHGFSPFQLALGQNPRLPSATDDKPPACTPGSSTKALRDSLDAIHKARESFIQSESSERIRRALNHNVRTSSDKKFLTGDSVYYKKANERCWRGPGKVLGQDGQQVLIKHGSTYVRCHPCRISLDKRSSHQFEQQLDRNGQLHEWDSNQQTDDGDKTVLGESDSNSETENESPISAAEMPQASSSPNTEPPRPQESVDHANVENSGSHGMSKLMKNMKVRFKRINKTAGSLELLFHVQGRLQENILMLGTQKLKRG